MTYKTVLHDKRYLSRSHDFTLLELLVVISIIMILVSMLLPALSQTKGKAYGIKCNGNLKQISAAYNMYVNDNSEWLISYGTGKYLTSLIPYIAPDCNDGSVYNKKLQEKMIYHCPSATATDSYSGSLYSYGQNEHMNSGTVSPDNWFLYKITRVAYPSMALLFTDANEMFVYKPAYISFRHNNGANVAYVDGHCSYVTYLYVSNNIQSSNYNFWYGKNSP